MIDFGYRCNFGKTKQQLFGAARQYLQPLFFVNRESTAAALLITRRLETLDPTHMAIAASLSISLGLASVIQSWTFLCVFCIYFLLIRLLIPMEEDGLLKAYGKQYIVYLQKSSKLVPFVY